MHGTGYGTQYAVEDDEQADDEFVQDMHNSVDTTYARG
jgi:hypothetical protein